MYLVEKHTRSTFDRTVFIYSHLFRVSYLNSSVGQQNNISRLLRGTEIFLKMYEQSKKIKRSFQTNPLYYILYTYNFVKTGYLFYCALLPAVIVQRWRFEPVTVITEYNIIVELYNIIIIIINLYHKNVSTNCKGHGQIPFHRADVEH